MGDYEYTDQLNRELLASARAAGNQNMLAAVQSVSGTLAWRRGDREAHGERGERVAAARGQYKHPHQSRLSESNR